MWQLPLLRLDMGSLYNKFIGETEKNLRESLQQAESMSPCVLWLDELEKALAQGGGDDGLNKRLLGYFLTWMAERKSQVFLVATSNDIQQLPAELVRKGRFDEIFFVDLPDTDVRRQIFEIHLRKRDAYSESLHLARLAEAAEGFSGAEIEQAVVSALYMLAEGEQLGSDHLLRAILQTTPLSVVMAEQLHALRSWAEGRTVAA
jgi:SpoVK/Ycf46/Vps4 family AAA+-type ATPase